MFKKELLEEVLAAAMSTGGDFAEIYAENTHNNTIQLVNGKIDRISDNVISGVGIRVFSGERTVYAHRADIGYAIRPKEIGITYYIADSDWELPSDDEGGNDDNP